MKTFITQSSFETQRLAQNLAKNFKSGVIALSGPLGAGKTTFVQGFAKGLGIKDKIISPTFVLIRQHKNLYHVDLYRINNFQELGLNEILENPSNIIIIEWAEKIKKMLPKDTTWITFEVFGETKRKIILS